MYKVYFYKDSNGKEPVLEYMRQLAAGGGKEKRIQLNKIHEYIQVLEVYGTRAGVPYVKHIDGDLWELRPLKDRIFFVAWQGDIYILLHHFLKKTRKTPKREIEQAKRKLKDLRKRGL